MQKTDRLSDNEFDQSFLALCGTASRGPAYKCQQEKRVSRCDDNVTQRRETLRRAAGSVRRSLEIELSQDKRRARRVVVAGERTKAPRLPGCALAHYAPQSIRRQTKDAETLKMWTRQRGIRKVVSRSRRKARGKERQLGDQRQRDEA